MRSSTLTLASTVTATTGLSRSESGLAPGPVATLAVANGAEWLAAAVSAVFVVTATGARQMWPDSFYELYAGRYVLAHGIPYRNVVTLASAGAPWIDQQWLAQILYYRIWSIGGFAAMTLVTAALVAGGFAFLGTLMLHRGVPPIRVFIWTMAAFAVSCGYSSMVRAQSFGYLLAGFTLWLVATDGEKAGTLDGPRRRTWLVIGVLVLWANIHGSVLFGSGLVILYAGYRATRALTDRAWQAAAKQFTFGVAAAAAVLCTPYGTGVIGYYRSLIGNSELAHNMLEWAPPSLADPWCWAFFALVAGVAVAVTVARRRGCRPDPLLVLIAGFTLALALSAFRNMAWFGFAGSLLAADSLARGRGASARVHGKVIRRATAGLLLGLAAATVISVAGMPSAQFVTWLPKRAIAVSDALAARYPSVKILGDQWSSAGMLWARPDLLGRVGFDGRYEQYSRIQLTAYFDFIFVHGPNWARVTSGYQVLVISRTDRALVRAVSRLPGWRIVYSDRYGLVLARPPLPRWSRPTAGRSSAATATSSRRR
jgi:hypothetical protein